MSISVFNFGSFISDTNEVEEMNKVYAVRIDMYYTVMGDTYCECCGPETDYEFQGYVLESLHADKEDAEKVAKDIDTEVELHGIEYDFAQVSVDEMEVN